jgi:hypothetical protein
MRSEVRLLSRRRVLFMGESIEGLLETFCYLRCVRSPHPARFYIGRLLGQSAQSDGGHVKLLKGRRCDSSNLVTFLSKVSPLS